jgi:hypothetical protein
MLKRVAPYHVLDRAERRKPWNKPTIRFAATPPLYDWAEPGEPPNPDFPKVRAKPLAKPTRHGSISHEVETELVRRYHEDGDLDALEQLVEAHRPMVVHMAKHRRGMPRKVLVEYGMLGLRLAAEPPRPSLTKKGKTVGFDPAEGHRFGTYARHYADKEMNAALGGYVSPALKPEFKQKATVKIEDWGAVSWNDEDASREESAIGEALSEDDLPLRFWLRSGLAFRYLEHRSPYRKPPRVWKLGQPPAPRKPRPRNFLVHPRTDTELRGLDLYYARHYPALLSHGDLAKAGIEGWEEDKEDSDFFLASFFRSHAFEGEEYRLPDAVLRER